MKELSIEEKAKRYDEALDNAKVVYKTIRKDLKPVIEQIFPELEESENEKVIRDIKVVLECSATKFFKEEGKMPIWYDRAVAWLEKQGKQKPVDKVEAKFKVGDWISNEQYTRLVVGISFDLGDYYYMFEDGTSKRIEHIDKKYHLWSIEDAKDGDVLVSVYNNPFIYNGKFTELTINTYCGINVYDVFVAKSSWSTNKDVRPATKEQHDTLFAKMKEAGYEWDDKKKELKKMNSIFPFQAKIKQTGKIITIIAGQLDTEGKKYIQYQSDKNDGYSVYNPNDFEKLNC